MSGLHSADGPARDDSRSRETPLDLPTADIAKLLSNFRDLDFVKRDPLYAIPGSLLSAITTEMPNWLPIRSLEFEREYTSFCESLHCIGFWNAQPIQSDLVDTPTLPDISVETFHRLGWAAAAIPEDAFNDIHAASRSIEVIKERMWAYSGWLLTEPAYLADLKKIRDLCNESGIGRQQLNDLQIASNHEADAIPLPIRDTAEKLSRFLSKWKLGSMLTWDLPSPLGARIGGSVEMSRLAGLKDEPLVQAASTIRLPAEMLTQGLSGTKACDHHLSEWHKIQERNHKSGLNYGRLGKILRIRFYWDTVLASRYSDLFKGNIQSLDIVFASYFRHTDPDATKQLRTTIRKRLAAKPMTKDNGRGGRRKS